jgi:hypothetical protein
MDTSKSMTHIIISLLQLQSIPEQGRDVMTLTYTSLDHVPGPPKLVRLQMDMAIHTYEDIMRLTDNLSEKYIVGYGASSTVYTCVLKSGKAIAVKRLYSHYNHTAFVSLRLNWRRSVVSGTGIVLLELLTGKKAVDNESNLHQLVSHSYWIY